MRLQGAIIQVPEGLFDPSGAPLAGAEQFLALMKMEGVWLFALTHGPRRDAQGMLEKTGLNKYFRGLIAQEEYGCTAALYEKALRRLRTHPAATLAITAKGDLLPTLRDLHLTAVLVSSAPSSEERALAADVIEHYEVMTEKGW